MIASQVNDWQEFDRLIDGACDWTLSADQWTKLGQWLVESPEARVHYLACMDIHGTLAWQMMSATRLSPTELQQYTQAEMDLLATEDGNSCDASLPVSAGLGFFSSAFPSTLGYSSGWAVAYSIATVITGLWLLSFWLMPVSQPEQVARQSDSLPSPLSPLPSVVGRITGMVDCNWGEGSEVRGQGSGAASLKSLVALGEQFALASGLMEITYDTGAKVILQGPVTYEVEANGGYLAVGKLTGKLGERGEGRGERERKAANSSSPQPLVPSPSTDPQSPIPNPFVIHTPTATVTDLGTEFGVEVDKAGTTQSHVFRGSVEVQVVAADGRAVSNAQVLHENQWARVEEDRGKQDGGNRITVFVTPAKPADFVREIPKLTMKTLDLVDVVAGGNGFSAKRDRGIDPISGRLSDTPPPSQDFQLTTDGKYHRVLGLPLIDGVFIPDGRNGRAQQIDSSGHTFSEFKNSDGRTVHYIWAAGTVPVAPSDSDGSHTITYPTRLAGVETDFSSPGHGFLFMHTNKGITFDLAAIRRADPNHKVARFRCVAGNAMPQKTPEYVADLWVFVDGKVRFVRRGVTGWGVPSWITIPLCDRNRFLTLAATDGGDEIGRDFIIFGDPVLEMATIEKNGGGL